MTLADIIHRHDTPAGKLFDWASIALILFSITTLTIETVPGLSPATRHALDISEIVVSSLFLLEYILRLATSRRKIRYAFSFYGIIDLLAVLPFLLGLGIDARSIRMFWFLRALRLLKLERYMHAADRFGAAIKIVREEIVLFAFAAGILLYLSSVGIYYFENTAQPHQFSSIPDSMWWAVATLTTVGYGDVYPITVGGKIFTFIILMLGLGVIAIPSGLMAMALTEARKQELARNAQADKEE